MKRQIQEKGLAHIGLVIAVVVVVAAVAFGGWYVWGKNKDDKNSDNKSNSSQNNNSQNQNEEPNEQTKYLLISEWGVRFTLPEDMQDDVTYFVNNRAYNDFGGPITVDLLSKHFSAGAFKCAEIEGEVPRSLISIYRESESEGTNSTSSPNFIGRIGDSLYFLTQGTNCEQAIEREGSSQDKQLVADLKQAVKETLEKAE